MAGKAHAAICKDEMEVIGGIGELLENITNRDDLIMTREPSENSLGHVDRILMDPRRDEWESVLSSIIIGLRPIKLCLFEGQYLQAATLIRQELESLAQLKHITLESRSGKYKPSLSVIKEEHLKALYGPLSELAHLTTHAGVSHAIPSNPLVYDYNFSALLPRRVEYVSSFNNSLFEGLYMVHNKILRHILADFIEYVESTMAGVEVPESCRKGATRDRQA